MAFESVSPKVDFPALERSILKFWDRIGAFEKLRAKNKGKRTWSFLDGPITANNPMGVHHAWGRTYKDVFGRYFAATGHDLRYQNGFDCQGLWVEVEVEREHGFKTKADIESYGLDRFTEECKARVRKYSAIQTQQSIRLGYWMDWNNSYYTMTDANNYAIWAFLRKCHQHGYLYKGTDVMPWSGKAGCAYSHMEIAEGRKLVTHTSVFVRFPIRGRQNEYLLIWTTTPWTLTSNTGAAVSSELDYVRLRANKDGAVYYFAADNLKYQRLETQFKEGFGRDPWPKGLPKLRTIHQIFEEQGGYAIEGTVPGGDMIDWAYDGPFDELPAQQQRGGYAQPIDLIEPAQRDWPSGKDGHRVFDPGTDYKGEPYVVAGEGTGIVHSAPGCGDIDHAWGKHFHMAAIAPLDEEGRFVEGFGKFTGLRASDRQTAQAVIADLKDKGLLVATEEYPHIYPHCWRTGDELIFRLVDEWYISMDWRDEIKEMAQRVNWLPPAMRGIERELDWLTTMKDWMISKKRYWGLALPIWECPDCGRFDVLGGREDLKERAAEGWDRFDGHSPHRPYVDWVRIKCANCGSIASRVPDVGNPWLDAGIVAYSTTRYSTDRQYWEKWIPADLITECFPGQFRNWFYSILAMSTMMELGKPDKRPPFRNLLGHALVLDENRQVMHKSDGTAIWFEEAAEQLGVDTMRWMYCVQPPTVDLPFGLRHPGEHVAIDCPDGTRITDTVDGEPLCRVTSTPADEIRRRVLLMLWNSYAFLCNYARLDAFDPATPPVPLDQRQDIDRWILSDLQLVIRSAHENFRSYSLPPVCHRIEKFLDDLSTWYIRRNRRRFWRGACEGDTDKLAAYQTLYEVLVTLAKVVAPIVPFVTEHIYQRLVAEQVDGAPESIHLCDYPEVDETRIDSELSEAMAAVVRIVSLARSARTASKLKVRQPLAELIVASGNEFERRAVARFADHLLDELNVKKVSVRESAADLCEIRIDVNKRLVGAKYGSLVPAIIQAVSQVDPVDAAAKVSAGECVPVAAGPENVLLEPGELVVDKSYGQDWVAAEDQQTIVLLDKRITTELKHEGIARDVVRNVQNLRKEMDLNIEDRIVLSLQAESEEVSAGIEAFRDYIARETLAVELTADTLTEAVGRKGVSIGGAKLDIAVRKA
ncbi:MAG: class I tRNA ligase family protein [Phycisphaerales bacterium]|nr:MAG: class I tRNA ligase family protein [Phycisphaerales bacterium]